MDALSIYFNHQTAKFSPFLHLMSKYSCLRMQSVQSVIDLTLRKGTRVTDRIRVKRLAFFGYHGIFDEEAVLGQRFFIDIEAHVDLRQSGVGDNLDSSVRYDAIADTALEVATGNRFQTIEALAEAVADHVLSISERISMVIVGVEKPSAPVRAILDSVSVEIERRRHA